MNEEQEKKDSFSIGTASTGGAVKVYFDINDPEAITKMDKAIQLWKNAQVVSGKAK